MENANKILDIRPVRFSIGEDDNTEEYNGFTDGRRWNGWQMPYFTREVVDLICARWPAMRYDAEQDAFVVASDDPLDDDEVYKAQVSNGTTYYAIGAGSWTWDLAEGQTNPFDTDYGYNAREFCRFMINLFINNGFDFDDPLVSELLTATSPVTPTDAAVLRPLVVRSFDRLKKDIDPALYPSWVFVHAQTLADGKVP